MNVNRTVSNEDGQALVELAFVLVFTLMVGYGFYEVGALIHNLSVMQKSIDTVADYATKGASIEKLREEMIESSENLLSTAFIQQDIGEKGIIIEIWNPHTGQKLGAYSENGLNYREQCSQTLAPRSRHVTPYIFWARGYEFRLGVRYTVGIFIPFLGNLITVRTMSSTRTMRSQNDLDRDGLVDSREANYVNWRMNQPGGPGDDWTHPRHRDSNPNYDSDAGVDIDGDGNSISSDTAPYDYNNNGTGDMFEPASASAGVMTNLLYYNPLVGPDGWDPDFPCS
jgi:Flp pilus assembly protein TadG